MKGVSIVRIIKLDLTADDWQLYSVFGRDYVAREMNQKIQHILNDNNLPGQRTYAEQLCFGVLRDWIKYGANDTEGRSVLQSIIFKFYGYEE